MLFLKFSELCRSPRTRKYSLDTVALEGTIRIFCLERLLTLHSPKPPGIINYTAKSIPCKGKHCIQQENNIQELLKISFKRINSLFCECPASILAFCTLREGLAHLWELLTAASLSDPNRSGDSPAITALTTVSLISLFFATGIAANIK